MAITLDSKPKLYCPAHHEVPFYLSATDLGTAPERIDIGMYLADNSGTRLHPLNKKIKPRATGVSYRKDFKSLCEKLVYTSFPTDSASQQIDPYITKKVKLYYGPVTFNSTTCETITNQVTTQSSIINLINANCNADTQALFGTSTGYTLPRTGLLLSQRPDIWKMVYGAKDYMWFLGAGTIAITFYNGTATVGTHSFTFTGADTVKYISLDQLVYSHTDTVTRATVFVSDGVIERNYYVEYCCKPDQDDYVGILFLEPLGGRSMLPTGLAFSEDVERTHNQIHKQFDLTSTSVTTGNRTISHAVGTRKRTFRTEVVDSPGAKRFIENFFSSAGYHAQKGYGANTKWEKFILDPGSRKVKELNKVFEIEFTGELSEIINSQVEDI